MLSLRDLAAALRDRDVEVVPGILSRVEACGQQPTVIDAAILTLRMRPRPELRRRLELMVARLSAPVDEPTIHLRHRALLTPRELEVARAAAGRERSKEIATRLGTSVRTVETQLQSVYRKLEVASREGLRSALHEAGLFDVGARSPTGPEDAR